MNNLLFIDSETGGLSTEKHSVLTVAMIAMRDGVIIGEKEWDIRQPPLSCDPQALAINGVDIRKPGLTHKEFQDSYWESLNEWFFKEGYDPEIRPRIAGHNVGFDLRFLRKALEDRSYGFVYDWTIDTMQLAKSMAKNGIISPENFKLTTLCNAFKLELAKNETYHSALGDVRQTVKLYEKLKSVASGVLQK
jgi:DNA polymerase III epsilon subunit-like protein